MITSLYTPKLNTVSKPPLEADERELLMLAENDAGPDGLLTFVPYLTKQWQGSTYAPPEHLRPVADLIARAMSGEPVRACVSVAPRHGKTEMLLHSIAWWLMQRPEDTVAYVSYAAAFAQSRSHRARDLAQRAGVRLQDDFQRLGEWRTTKGGGLLAMGIGGQMTGHGVNLLLIDDPVKNRVEAESVLIRQRNWDWFTSTAYTRVEPNGSVLVVHARWHDDDLIGRLTKETDVPWEVVNIPAVDDAGAPLWSKRWSVAALEEIRKTVHGYDWSALYMGRPRPKGDRLFRDPARYDKIAIDGARIVIACDPAATARTTADHSAIVVLSARKLEGTAPPRANPLGLAHHTRSAALLNDDNHDSTRQVYDVLEVWRGQVEIPQLLAELKRMQMRWHAPIVVEAVGGFKAVPQMLKQMMPEARIAPIDPIGDKFTRALGASAAWNDGRVRVPSDAPWLRPFLDEVTNFTGVGDRQDDQVDSLAHAFNTLTKAARPVKRGAMVADNLPFG